ncbi:MAG: YggS family pyridoxal phosphate-dependent enzyme [Oscillospiraceae bacterium]|nr:YggS family pyridoxal phosphate-dependent enzyme [Oscillospiraceae bacterium]
MEADAIAKAQQAVLTRLAEIRKRIASACEEAGRDPQEVTLMAVTKTVDPALINTAVDAGVTVLGENRVQEYLSKRDAYRRNAEVQFIGHLQTNKVRQIIDGVSMIQSVDSLHLAEAIDRAAAAKGIVMPVLLEVNIGGELSKSGVDPDGLLPLLKAASAFPHITVRGLMTIPPPETDRNAQDAVFARMKALFDAASAEFPMDTLSMGMSGDYESAVRHGATVVRIGSALFGARVYPQPQN